MRRPLFSSKPLVISSISSTSGSDNTARNSDKRCCSPPDRTVAQSAVSCSLIESCDKPAASKSAFTLSSVTEFIGFGYVTADFNVSFGRYVC